MEDSSYTDLKSSLSSVPVKALNCSSRLKLANNLNIKLVLPAKNGSIRDYRGLAELMGFQHNDIKNFERHEDPTKMILESWETHPNAMLDKLISYLEEMERYDVINELSPLLVRDVETYKTVQTSQNQKLQEIPVQVPEEISIASWPENLHSEKDMQLTRDDVINGECTFYDAYVSYADADLRDVCLLANYLESEDIGLKLFIRARDMLAGCPELDTNIELIKNRCRRMLIILTSNYVKSTACEFQTSFAASLAIEQSQRLLIPVIIEPCEIPPILKYVSKIDFTKAGNNNWVYEKLINSLLPEHRSPMLLASLEKSSKQRIMPPKLRQSSSSENIPAITFTPSREQLSNSGDISKAEVISSKNAVKNSPEVPSKTKKWKFPSPFKKTRISSNGYSSNGYSSSDSVSSSSSATSGFHSQSRNTLESFESFVGSYSNDTPL